MKMRKIEISLLVLFIVFLFFNILTNIRVISLLTRLDNDWLEFLECNDLGHYKIKHHK